MQLYVYKGNQLWQSPELSGGEVSLTTPIYELDELSFDLVDVPGGCEIVLSIGDEVIDESPRAFWDRSSAKRVLQWPENRYFEKYAGRCDIRFNIRPSNGETTVARQWSVPVQVLPHKVTQEEFDQLLEDVAAIGRGLLYDIYGRSQLGLQMVSRGGDFAPEEQLNRIREFVGRIVPVLKRIDRTPGHRVQVSHKVQQFRDSRLDSDSVVWLASHPEELTVVNDSTGSQYWPERVLVAEPHRNYDIYEHRMIKGTLIKLLKTLDTLAELAQTEIRVLDEERTWKDQTTDPGKPTWWQSYNAPRIKAAQNRLVLIESIRVRIQGLIAACKFLQEARADTSSIRLTPLFHQHSDYATVYRTITRLQRDATFVPNVDALTVQSRDLPTLYETWCFLRLVDALSQRVTLRPGQSCIQTESGRYTLHIRSDQPIIYQCGSGMEIRLYSQRKYYGRDTASEGYGRITAGPVWIPDVSMEFFRSPDAAIPFAIYVFDAKYKSYKHSPDRQERDWDKMWKYVHSIGTFHDSKPLVKHAWVLTAAEENVAQAYIPTFWSPAFAGQPTVGTIPLRPRFDMEQFLRVFDRLLEVDGISLE